MAGPTNPNVVNFTAPVNFEGGSQIPANQISRFEYGFASTPQASKNPRVYPVTTVDTDFSADANGKQFGPIPPTLAIGQWYAAGRTITKDGAVSEWGNEVAFVVEAKKPESIKDFSVA